MTKSNLRVVEARLARDPPALGAVLIHGADPVRVADLRARIVLAIAGPDGAADMRVTRMAAEAIRKDPATLADALAARPFFPGATVVAVDDAADRHAPAILAALEARRTDDAALVVTAGQLTARSTLRKGFEGHGSALSVPLYADPAGPDQIAAMARDAGLPPPDGDAMAALTALARGIEPAELRGTIQKLSLLTDGAPASPADVALCAPATTEAEADELADAVAEGRADAVPALSRKLASQGATPVSLSIALMRHFRTLHRAACMPGAPAQALARARPPVFGPRQDRMARQVERWGRDRLEVGVQVLLEADRLLRSSATVPDAAGFERALVRLANLARR
ncbi:MAG: DNA polymerase III subunit delta [Paracoccaceae bacterium]